VILIIQEWIYCLNLQKKSGFIPILWWFLYAIVMVPWKKILLYSVVTKKLFRTSRDCGKKILDFDWNY
jgi:hypothetical protein